MTCRESKSCFVIEQNLKRWFIDSVPSRHNGQAPGLGRFLLG
ncbi:hypothetical protein F383_09797 [Gossypium arboreum]|uniref:Uncharacterized protein n=1 Tax=Gossypium arboreum TaxID=29729 RepID=A0A0B0MH23_GOSAR|nr:hypothetical protein F383_16929 [Gossypium arboreum]KHG26907.1 hypothetical protein F383_09797 [Gossypium arboreum]